MSKKKYKVTQIREVEVEAGSENAAKILANKAFYGNRPSKADPEGLILSAVQVTDTTMREAA